MSSTMTSVGLDYDIERFNSKHTPGPGGCWLWGGTINSGGYGIFHIRIDGKFRQFVAHRVLFERLHGEVDPELHIDHICRVRNCVNPDHLRAVTAAENTLAGISIFAINARKTHCDRGHPFDDENTYHWRDTRACKECKRATVSKIQKTRTPCPHCGVVMNRGSIPVHIKRRHIESNGDAA